MDECQPRYLTKTKRRSSSGLAPFFNCLRFSARRSLWEALTFRYLLKLCLGVLLDSKLTFAPHVRRLSGKCFYHLRQMRTVRRRSQKTQRRQWCMRLLQVELTTATVLFTVQVRFTFDPCKMHSVQLLDLCCTSGSLTISLLTFRIVYICYIPLQQRVEYKVSLLIYKFFHQAAPSYLAEICVPVSATDNRCHLRSATHGDVAVPRIRWALGKIRKKKFLCVWSAAV